ncbi:MAG: hypothetical protein QOD82_7433 [Pseudonocardiales bacterium]|jgi:glycosyltransferase involved in cell wall biosynthesis|nr:hypothetical protein [Pseudonocardiales bacterium]
MRILQVINIGFEAGGAEKSVRLIMDGLGGRGHEVRVVSTNLLLSGAAGQEVFAHDLVPAITGNPATRLLGYFWHQPAHRQVKQILRDFRPDVVHLHTIGEFSPAVLAATQGYPRVLTVHGPEDWTRSLLRWNLVSATSGGRLTAADAARYLYLRFLQRPAYLPWLRRLDRVLTPSQYYADAVRPDIGPVPVFVTPNGIERSTFPEPIAETGHLVFVGRLEPVKGVHVLLGAFRELLAARADARLTIVGDGTDRAPLEAAAADLTRAGRVTFRGWLSQDGVADCLKSASVVVLPSLWPENFPTVALEALQLGRPLVASRVGGLPELVGEDNGALVAAGDVAGLARALGFLIGDRQVLERMGNASAVRAGRYGVEEFLDALEHHYKEVVAQ